MPRLSPILLIAASISGVVSIVVVGGLTILLANAWFGLPVGAQGPDQPIAYRHTVHAGAVEDGGLGLDCTFCHRNVTKGAAATIPSVQQCMFCHTAIDGTTEVSKLEIDKIQEAYANNEPINWVRVHRLPDHVEFVHDAHLRFFMEEEGMTLRQVCSTCHGEVWNMAKVKQVRALKMGDCVDCHREHNAPTDCTTCHY